VRMLFNDGKSTVANQHMAKRHMAKRHHIQQSSSSHSKIALLAKSFF